MTPTADSTGDDLRQASADLRREVVERTTELDAALAREAATAEVLKVINSSPGDLAPVFDTMLEKAHTLCGAVQGAMFLFDGEHFRAVATRGMPEAFNSRMRAGYRGSDFPLTQPLLAGEPFNHVVDMALVEHPVARAAVELAGAHTVLAVALHKDDVLLGQIVAARQEVRPFNDKQIALLQNFAAQAVIAMENARLLTETREALEQQTATAEVLGVINSSPGDLQPVFDAMLDKAMRLCGASFGHLVTWDGEYVNRVAARGASPAEALLQRYRPTPGSAADRMLRGENVIGTADLREEPGYRAGSPGARVLVDHGGARSYAAVALRKDGELLGAIAIYRTEVRPFSEKEIALLQNFAAQAVVAMENARLIAETREALEQQTATAEVLGVINSSPGDLVPVFDAMLEKAMRLCEAEAAHLLRYENGVFSRTASRGVREDFDKILPLNTPVPHIITRDSIPYRMVATRAVVHVHDSREDESVRAGAPDQTSAVASGIRTALFVPLLKEGEVVGGFVMHRMEVRPFADRQIALLQNFAAQAVVAMENARLITETREALEQQTATAEVLGIINSSPGELQPVFDAMLEKATKLCEAASGHLYTCEGEAVRLVAAQGDLRLAEHIRQRGLFRPAPGVSQDRILRGDRVVHIVDASKDEAYRAMPTFAQMSALNAVRTLVSIALRKDNALLGILTLYRPEVRPFSDKEIALLQNFAAQAVIAMENARLLGELRQRTDEVAELNRDLEGRVAEQVEELGRVGRLKRFLAPQLAELIVSQGEEKILESHRREIVVVFCDLRGYTAFTETAEPEEVLDFLREYHGALGPLVSQFEGTLDQFSGDGIMVFFNDPVPISDPAARAVNMAVAMREAAGMLIANWRERGRDLGFGAGIAQGYATLGQIGFSERSGYTAIGTVCNVAARLCAEAKNGQILLSQRVNVALKGSVATEQLGPLALKGLSQPVIAYDVPLTALSPALRSIEGAPQSI